MSTHYDLGHIEVHNMFERLWNKFTGCFRWNSNGEDDVEFVRSAGDGVLLSPHYFEREFHGYSNSVVDDSHSSYSDW